MNFDFNMFFTMPVLVFLICSLINVVLQTIKTVLTVKAGKLVACLSNAVAFGFYAVIVKQLAENNMIIGVTITIFANLIGVWFAKWLMDKCKKPVLWRISCTVPSHKINYSEITEMLDGYNIEYNLALYEKGHIIDIFSYSQGESGLIREIINNHNLKYSIMEIERKL